MLNIAITGGIGSGKTQASDYLRGLGYTVIDADAMARDITAIGGKALPLIRKEFGDILFNEDGSLDRAAVREMIYTDPAKKSRYEACTTKLVLDDIAEIKERSKKAGESVVFFDIPLLFETGTENEYDLVWVITADIDIRKHRVMERSKIDEATIDRIIQKQTPDTVKIAKADYVIRNNGTIDDLQASIDEAINFFKITLAKPFSDGYNS